ncbi:MAG: DUF5684 domain-containing protein [Pseudolysinimonas sp.]
MDPLGNDTAAGVTVILLAYLGLIVVILLVQYVLTGITLGMFFVKVGVSRGIAWVPIYNHWTWLKVGGQPGAIALLYLTPASIVARVFEVLGMYRSDIAFRKDSVWVVLGIFLPWLWCILLAQPHERYEPELLAAAGYPPPMAGYGSPGYGAARQQPTT